MDKAELITLEKKTRSIVEALSHLEKETERQKEMGSQLEQGKDALLSLADNLSVTSSKLSDAIELLHKSTLAKDIELIDTRISAIQSLSNSAHVDVQKAEELCRSTAELSIQAVALVRDIRDRLERTETACAELLTRLESVGAESGQRDAELLKRLESIELMVGRIDRNTQKGFGKERG